METRLTRNIGKLNTSINNRDPLYPGDLIYNDALYKPEPDYLSPFFKRLSMSGEAFACIGSRAKAPYKKKAMTVAAMSTGYNATVVAEQYPDRIRQMTMENFGESFLTVQRLSKCVSRDTLVNDVIIPNAQSNNLFGEIAAHSFADHVINAPAQREGFLRALSDIHPLLQSAHYEDWTFEKHIWGPEVMLDTDTMIYYGDKSYSRCGAMEQAVAVAIQYGNPLLLQAREGDQMDTKDIYGRDIAQVDQAWEDCKHIVDVVERGFRNEASAMLILSRFMHDQWYETKTGPLLHNHVHHSVSDRTPEDAERMRNLKQMMIPYLATRCDWKTLHTALDKDPSLKKFWEDEIVPHRDTSPDIGNIQKTLFSYQPRGGFEHPVYHSWITERRDLPRTARQSYKRAAHKPRLTGAHVDVFDPKWHSRKYEDYSFERLGATSDPTTPPHKDQLSYAQLASYVITNAVRVYSPPLEGSRTLLHIGYNDSGEKAAWFHHDNNITHWREAGTSIDPLRDGGNTLHDSVIQENAAHYNAQIHSLMRQEKWRKENDIGSIDSVAMYTEFQKDLTARRDGYQTDRRAGIAAQGPRTLEDATTVCINRSIDHKYTGIIIPKGPVLKDAAYTHIMQALNVATGLVNRPQEGQKYQMDFFYDHEDGLPPENMDLGDLILHVGKTIEHALDQPDPPALKTAYVTMARLLDVYEKKIDPGRCNVDTHKDPVTGRDRKETIIDWLQVSPGLTAFLQDDPAKAQKVHDMWFRMRGQDMNMDSSHVKGKLLARGIHAFDVNTLQDLPPEYKQAHNWWAHREALEKLDTRNRHTVAIRGPRVGK